MKTIVLTEEQHRLLVFAIGYAASKAYDNGERQIFKALIRLGLLIHNQEAQDAG